MLIMYELPDEPGTFAIETTIANIDAGAYIRGVVGVGNPFYAFPNNTDFGFSVWDGYVANWTGAPICNVSASVNNSAIMAMLDNPPTNKISEPE